MQIKTKTVSSRTAEFKPVKQEVNVTVILPPLVYPGLLFGAFISEGLRTYFAEEEKNFFKPGNWIYVQNFNFSNKKSTFHLSEFFSGSIYRLGQKICTSSIELTQAHFN